MSLSPTKKDGADILSAFSLIVAMPVLLGSVLPTLETKGLTIWHLPFSEVELLAAAAAVGILGGAAGAWAARERTRRLVGLIGAWINLTAATVALISIVLLAASRR
jgi:hypothetical protein